MTRITISLNDDDNHALDILCDRDARDPRRFAALLLSRALHDEMRKIQRVEANHDEMQTP